MHVLYRFEGQGLILEQEVCSTTPINIKSPKTSERAKKRLRAFLWDTMYVYVYQEGFRSFNPQKKYMYLILHLLQSIP